MSSTKYAAPLLLELRPSRRLIWFLLLSHGGALLLLWPLALPASAKSMLALGIAVSARQNWRLHISRHSARAILALLWRDEGGWLLTTADGRQHDATLAGSVFLRPWLVVLPLRWDRRPRRIFVPLLPDMLAAESFRRLRVRLRLEAGRPGE